MHFEVFESSTVAPNHDFPALPVSVVGMESKGGSGGLDTTQDGRTGEIIEGEERETV